MNNNNSSPQSEPEAQTASSLHQQDYQTSSFLDPNLPQRVIPEESSKENSSESSTQSQYKEKLIKEIHSRTLSEILKVRLKHELFQLFYFKYSVQTFE
jgi:hypothetical protein